MNKMNKTNEMNEKFHGKYRIPSARAQWWDYNHNGEYFITICTADKKPYFGFITDVTMRLSEAGKIADILWHEIVNHTNNVRLGEFIVMPNHIHGIILIDNPDVDTVETRHALSLHNTV